MSSKQFARRWRDCNKLQPDLLEDSEAENEWRTRNIELLNKAHTLGGISSISFDVVESNYGVSFLLATRRTR